MTLTKIIKNIDTAQHTWRGVVLDQDETYNIPLVEWPMWAINSQVIIDITNGKAVVNNGVSDITNISDAIDHLKASAETFAKDTEGRVKLATPQRDDGKLTIHTSAKPVGTSTYFTSCFDKILETTIDEGVAVDKGTGKVGLPCTAHGMPVGDQIVINGTIAYDGAYIVDTATTTNELVIMATYVSETFTGAETIKDHGIGNGQHMIVDFTTSDPVKSVEGTFLHDVWLKDGVIKFENAPKGALVTMQVICPEGAYYYKDSVTGLPCPTDYATAIPALAGDETVVSQFVCNTSVYKTNLIGEPFNAEDEARIPQGYKLKLLVTKGFTAVDFSVWVRLEMYRTFTKI